MYSEVLPQVPILSPARGFPFRESVCTVEFKEQKEHMPFLKVTTSASIDPENRGAFLKECSRLVSTVLNKPEQYVMVGLEPGSLLMSGDEAPAAMVEVRSLSGLDHENNQKLSMTICEALEKHLNIPPTRVFINFTQLEKENWGWNRDTFA